MEIEALFNKIPQKKSFENAISQIQEAIFKGLLKPGDKLPSERSLVELFGISRGSLREAYRILEQKGLIKVKVGFKGGATVCSSSTDQVCESLDILLRLQKMTLKELLDFRMIVEGSATERATVNVTPEGLDQIDSILELMWAYLRADELKWEKLVEQDIKFHLFLGKLSGNRLIESVLSTVHSNVRRYHEKLIPKQRQLFTRNYRDLLKIAKAMREKDSNKARKLAENHVKLFSSTMERRAKELLKQGEGDEARITSNRGAT